MNMQHTRRNTFVPMDDYQAHAELQVRRRQLLGLLLIIIGSIWFGLRLTGWVGDMHLPIGWLEETSVEVDRFTRHESSQFALLACCGMLTINPFRHIR